MRGACGALKSRRGACGNLAPGVAGLARALSGHKEAVGLFYQRGRFWRESPSAKQNHGREIMLRETREGRNDLFGGAVGPADGLKSETAAAFLAAPALPRSARRSGVECRFPTTWAASSRPRMRRAPPRRRPAAPRGPQYLKFPGKHEGLVLLGDRPLVAETPESLLDDDTTPLDKFYIRNNGQIPDETKTRTPGRSSSTARSRTRSRPRSAN